MVGGDDCPFKADLYKYQNNHQYVSYGKKATKLDENTSLKQCNSYKIKFDIEKNEQWIPSWSSVSNNHVYVFQVDKNADQIYNIDMLYNGLVSISEGQLSLPKNSGDKYFSLKNSELGEKEIYLFSYEEADEILENEYGSLLSGEGKKKNFYETFLKPEEAVFNFYLKENDAQCFDLDIEVKHLYRKNGQNDFQELKDGEVLHSGDQYKIEFKHDKDVDVYVFLVNEAQEKARVLFPCYKDYQDSRLGFGSHSNPLIAKEKNTLPNPTEVGYWQLNNSVGDEQIHFLVFKQGFSPKYNRIGQCEISFDAKLKDEIIFESLRRFKQ